MILLKRMNPKIFFSKQMFTECGRLFEDVQDDEDFVIVANIYTLIRWINTYILISLNGNDNPRYLF